MLRLANEDGLNFGPSTRNKSAQAHTAKIS
jgi:hypothetical protein